MNILIDNRTEHNVNTEIITCVVKAALLHENFSEDAEVSVSIVDSDEIREINNKFRKLNKPTDVLSFPLSDTDEYGTVLLGDIIINIESAVSQAKEYGHSFERELGFLTAHSMLHLLGYDHEFKDDEKIMFAKQEEILSKAGLERNGLTACHEELIKLANEAMDKAYAPYSCFKVGAALLTKSGKLYTGCNVENASYGASNCAERTAVFKAISEGEREFEKICVVSQNDDFTPPCGICRQVISEFMPDGEIILTNGRDIKIYKADELLPHRFKL